MPPLNQPVAGVGTATRRSTLPRYRRDADKVPPFLLTARDVALLEDVWRFGLLTTGQMESLRAADADPERRFVSRRTLTRRLQGLYHHRYLRRIARPLAQGSREPVYVLDHAGARALSLRHGEVTARPPSRLPKAIALDHLLETVQVRVALAAQPASEPQSLRLLEWLPGDKARFRAAIEVPGERRQNVSIVPDAGFILRAGGMRHYCFLEVDRGTEAQRILAAKCRAYAAYWMEGGFARDFGVPRELGFWVLFVSPSARRTQTILKAAEAAGDLKVIFRVAPAEAMSPGRISTAVWESSGAAAKQRFFDAPG